MGRMCECARNEKGRVDEFKESLQCTFWPDSPSWRSQTLYQVLKPGGECDGFPQPVNPNIAKSTLHIFSIPMGTGNQAMEVETLGGTTVDPGVIAVDILS